MTALIVSVISLVFSWRGESDRRRDSLRARLRWDFEKFLIGTSRAINLWLCNDGPAVASGIEIELDGRPVGHSDLVARLEVPSELDRGARFKCGVLISGEDRSIHTVKLRWKDGSGEPQEKSILC